MGDIKVDKKERHDYSAQTVVGIRALILIFFVASLIIFFSERSVGDALDEILNRWVSNKGETPEPEAPLVAQADGSTRQDSEDPLDEEVLAGLRELGDAELLAELVEVFFEDVPPRLAALQETTESVEGVAHTLKGGCGNMGAWRMAQICAELQDTGASADLSRAPDLLEQLEAEFGRVRPALEAEVARSRG